MPYFTTVPTLEGGDPLYPYQPPRRRPPGGSPPGQPPRQPGYYQWTEPQTEQFLTRYQGGYIRTSIPGYGLVLAQLLSYDPTTGLVALNIFNEQGYPEYTQVDRRDLTGLTFLGWEEPPEIRQRRRRGRGQGGGRNDWNDWNYGGQGPGGYR